jgi:hypothetical protein
MAAQVLTAIFFILHLFWIILLVVLFLLTQSNVIEQKYIKRIFKSFISLFMYLYPYLFIIPVFDAAMEMFYSTNISIVYTSFAITNVIFSAVICLIQAVYEFDMWFSSKHNPLNRRSSF